ncbi:MAG: sensor histidine kinase [Syntrophobacteraceae bacterium]
MAEQMELELARLAAIVESSDDAIIGKTLEGTITSWNHAAEVMYGYSAGEVIGRPISILAPLDMNNEFPSILKKIARSEAVEHFETRRRRKNGEIVYVSLSVSPIRDKSGKVIGASTIARDISERKRMEEELRKSRDDLERRVRERTAEIEAVNRELEQSNQALRDFASIASHDLQEPLRKVISFGDMLQHKCADVLGQTGNDYLGRMLNATRRMQSLLAGLLEYSQVTTLGNPFVSVALQETVTEVLSDLEVRIRDTGAQVIVGELPVIDADATQMRQLFQNLIGNGLKFHREGENPVVRVVGSTSEGKHTITVEDNGIGFDERYLDRIFAPFQRLHGRNSRYEGTGMGLAICKKIMDRHGGSITAKSAPDAGAKFILELPFLPVRS